MNIKEPTGRLARWSLEIQQYNFEIIHRAGRSNGNADTLSRYPYDDLKIASFSTPGFKVDEIFELQRCDPTVGAIIAYFESGKLPENDSEERAIVAAEEHYFLNTDGILFHLASPPK